MSLFISRASNLFRYIFMERIGKRFMCDSSIETTFLARRLYVLSTHTHTHIHFFQARIDETPPPQPHMMLGEVQWRRVRVVVECHHHYCSCNVCRALSLSLCRRRFIWRCAFSEAFYTPILELEKRMADR